jgi:hypothetical protein
MLFLAAGNSSQIKVRPKPLGVATFLKQCTWATTNPEVAVVAPLAGDPSGCTAVVTGAKDAKLDAVADITWHYRNEDGKVASSSFMVRIVGHIPEDTSVTGGDIEQYGADIHADDAQNQANREADERRRGTRDVKTELNPESDFDQTGQGRAVDHHTLDAHDGATADGHMVEANPNNPNNPGPELRN